MFTDKERLDFIEKAARRSLTGVSFDWVPAVEGEPSGYRAMTRHNIREPKKSLRDAIDQAMKECTNA